MAQHYLGNGYLGSGWMIPLGLAALAGGAMPAIAHHPEPVAESLLPLESQEFVVEGVPDFVGVSEQINATTGNRKEAGAETASFDPRTLPLVNRFLDREGNVRLPLGLTVYTTLGDPSIGFGQEF